ncbi:MAG TPA: thiol-disulfide oxidoreductase DCC family protein [Rhodothermales bacterium]|nr:thiol-disulfide oxidoreductase DCC family protein [Rhodothermales bacterium]
MSTIKETEATTEDVPSLHAEPAHDVVFFDGVCNLCNGWVRFVILRDPAGVFRFAPLESDAAARAMVDRTMLASSDSIILLRDGRFYTRSGAVLRIVRRLRWPWPVLSALLIIPGFIRDFVYDLVARNRYRWFGRRDECMIPTPEMRDRFLG